MRKLAVFITSVLVLILTLGYLQLVFIPKDAAYQSEDELMFAQFFNEPKNSLDVIVLGNSSTRSAVLPPVLWERAGIASYNLAASQSNAAAQYYVLKEALRYQSPSVVVVRGLYLFSSFDFDGQEARFRTALDHVPLSMSKLDSIADIISNSEEQRFVDYVFPFFRYHNRHDLTMRDFDLSYRAERNLFLSSLDKDHMRIIAVQRPGEFFDPDFITREETYDEYLTKIIELCKSNDIDVVLFNPPTCRATSWSMRRYNILSDYADEHGVLLLDLNTAWHYSNAQFDESIDFADMGHLNVLGATKASLYLADFLSENFIFDDRRKTDYDPHWDVVLETYHGRYNEMMSKVGG